MAIGRINGVYYKQMYGRFVETKKNISLGNVTMNSHGSGRVEQYLQCSVGLHICPQLNSKAFASFNHGFTIVFYCL